MKGESIEMATSTEVQVGLAVKSAARVLDLAEFLADHTRRSHLHRYSPPRWKFPPAVATACYRL